MNRVPAEDCCANTPCARAQLGASAGSVPSAFTATRKAVMSPTSSIAIARALSFAVTRRRARASASASRVVCKVAKTAISASGKSAALRIKNSFAPVGNRAIAAIKPRSAKISACNGATVSGRGLAYQAMKPAVSLACQEALADRQGRPRRRSSDRPIGAPIPFADPCSGPSGTLWQAPYSPCRGPNSKLPPARRISNHMAVSVAEPTGIRLHTREIMSVKPNRISLVPRSSEKSVIPFGMVAR